MVYCPQWKHVLITEPPRLFCLESELSSWVMGSPPFFSPESLVVGRQSGLDRRHGRHCFGSSRREAKYVDWVQHVFFHFFWSKH